MQLVDGPRVKKISFRKFIVHSFVEVTTRSVEIPVTESYNPDSPGSWTLIGDEMHAM